MRAISNQKLVTISKQPCDKDNLFYVTNIKATFEAFNNLTKNELGIWLYLSCNQDKYSFALSTQHLSELTGIEKRNAQRAINSLVKKRYLEKTSEGSNHYIFHEIPIKEEGEK